MWQHTPWFILSSSLLILIITSRLVIAEPSVRKPPLPLGEHIFQAFSRGVQAGLDNRNYHSPSMNNNKACQSNGRYTTLTVRAYAYCLRGRTASGSWVKKGTVAVDPRVIPLGTKMFIPGYGWGTALDTGGKIKGKCIDLWFPTAQECYRWGVRIITIKVYR